MKYFCFLLVFCTIFTAIYAIPRHTDSVLLEDVQVLTFSKGEYTSGRRSSPIPKLNCVGGTAISQSGNVEVVQCYNMGFDGFDVNWKCESTIDDLYQLGKIEVSCEGYEHPDDPYILKNSCGLEFELNYTPKYYNQQRIKQQLSEQKVQQQVQQYIHQINHKRDATAFGVGMIIVLIIFSIYLCHNNYCRSSETKHYKQPCVHTKNRTEPNKNTKYVHSYNTRSKGIPVETIPDPTPVSTQMSAPIRVPIPVPIRVPVPRRPIPRCPVPIRVPASAPPPSPAPVLSSIFDSESSTSKHVSTSYGKTKRR